MVDLRWLLLLVPLALAAEGLPRDPAPAPVPEDTAAPEPEHPVGVAVTVSAGVEGEAVRQKVEAAVEGFEGCARDLRLVVPEATGPIRVDLTFRPVSGRVTLTRLLVVPGPNAGPMASCVEPAIRAVDWAGITLTSNKGTVTLALRFDG